MSARGVRTRHWRSIARLWSAACATSAALCLACAAPRPGAPRSAGGPHACAWCHDTESSLSWTVDRSGRPPLPRPPAGSDLEATLDEKNNARLRYRVDKLCLRCHTRLDPAAEGNSGLWLHGPFRAGLCLGCHEPHEPRAYRLLVAPAWPELCARCHQAYHGGRRETGYRQECSDCHAPHMRREAYPRAAGTR